MSSHKLSKAANGDHYVLVGRYDDDLVSELKALVPTASRQWRPIAKCWRIAPEYAPVVQSMLEERARASGSRGESN